MSLYYEAASILTDESGGGSLKSRVYNDTAKFKSRPAQLYALITETAKYDGFLKEVIDNADMLKLEPKVWRPCLLNMRVAAD
jgi:putative methyltransferase